MIYSPKKHVLTPNLRPSEDWAPSFASLKPEGGLTHAFESLLRRGYAKGLNEVLSRPFQNHTGSQTGWWLPSIEA